MKQSYVSQDSLAWHLGSVAAVMLVNMAPAGMDNVNAGRGTQERHVTSLIPTRE
jgi:hypothetical protein